MRGVAFVTIVELQTHDERIIMINKDTMNKHADKKFLNHEVNTSLQDRISGNKYK